MCFGSFQQNEVHAEQVSSAVSRTSHPDNCPCHEASVSFALSNSVARKPPALTSTTSNVTRPEVRLRWFRKTLVTHIRATVPDICTSWSSDGGDMADAMWWCHGSRKLWPSRRVLFVFVFVSIAVCFPSLLFQLQSSADALFVAELLTQLQHAEMRPASYHVEPLYRELE